MREKGTSQLSGDSPRPVLVLITDLVKLDAFAVELLFDDEFVVRVSSVFERFRRIDFWTTFLHQSDDVGQSSLQAVAEHGNEGTIRYDCRVLRIRSLVSAIARYELKIDEENSRRE